MNRTRWLYVMAFLLLAVYSLMSVLEARSAAERLAASGQDLREVQQKLSDIDRWQQAPKVAALRLESPAEIANRVAAARESAKIPQSALLRQQPTDPQRISRTDFELRTTTIELAPTTLPALLDFCDALHDEETGTLVRDIRLTTPQSGADGRGQERWAAVLTLTQMIFSPTSR